MPTAWRAVGPGLRRPPLSRALAQRWAPVQLAGVVDSLRTPTPTASSTPPTATMATTSRPVNGSLLFGSVLCSMRADVLYPCSADVAAPAGDATNRSATSDAIASSAENRRVTRRVVLSIWNSFHVLRLRRTRPILETTPSYGNRATGSRPVRPLLLLQRVRDLPSPLPCNGKALPTNAQ